MQILIWILRIIVIVLFVWFAARNADPVTVYGYLDSSVKAPLVLILLAFFGGGLLLGLLAAVPGIVRLKREVRKLNRALQQKTRELEPSVTPAPALPPSNV